VYVPWGMPANHRGGADGESMSGCSGPRFTGLGCGARMVTRSGKSRGAGEPTAAERGTTSAPIVSIPYPGWLGRTASTARLTQPATNAIPDFQGSDRGAWSAGAGQTPRIIRALVRRRNTTLCGAGQGRVRLLRALVDRPALNQVAVNGRTEPTASEGRSSWYRCNWRK